MCDPVTMTILAVATTGINIYAQNQTAKAQRQATEVQAENERMEALESSEEEIGQRIRAAREARSRARVAAGESGALGASFAASINQSLQDQDTDIALVSKNLAFTQRGIEDRANVAFAGIRKTSALQAGLQIATAGASGFSAGQTIAERKKGKTT